MARSRNEIEAEIATAKAALASLPDSRITERLGWEGVLAAAEAELEQVGEGVEALETLLYFDGGPVAGSRGIELRFASDVLKHFAMAAQHQAKKYSLESPSLHLTHGLAGSYGFAIEELEAPMLPGFEGMSSAAMAVRDIIDFVEAAGADRITLFNKLSPEMSKNAFAALRSFFEAMDSSGATFRIRGRARSADLDRRRVRLAAQRTAAAQIDEYEMPQLGKFEGFLPNSRKFEFRLIPAKKGRAGLLSGEVSPSADRDELQKFVGKRCVAILHVTEVAQGTKSPRRRYQLMDIITEREFSRRQAEEDDA